MKLAPLTFSLAVLLFLAAVATAKRTTPEDVVLPLDFSGIDTLEIIANNSVEISISADTRPEARHGYGETSKVAVTRQGSRLLVKANIEGYDDLELVIPASVRTIITNGASIRAKLPVASMDVRSSRALSWHGDVQALHITDTYRHRRCDVGCGNSIDINGGAIENLYVTSFRGNIDLASSKEIHAATLTLGPEASLSVSDVSSLARIQVLELPAQE